MPHEREQISHAVSNTASNFAPNLTSSQIAMEHPTIFPSNVIAGVTLRNRHLFLPTGLSLTKGQVLTDEELVCHRTAFANALQMPLERLCFQKQVHGTRIRTVLAASNHNNEEESDGLITQEQGTVLCAGMADCAGVLLYDPEHNAIAAIHSGWGGTKANIAQAGIARMSEGFSSKAASLLAYISPAASGERYEVRWDVAQHFPASVLKCVSEDQWLLDNRKRIVEQLIECGLRASNIEVSNGCTLRDEQYHSHRRDGAAAGRMAAFIGLQG